MGQRDGTQEGERSPLQALAGNDQEMIHTGHNEVCSGLSGM